MGKEYHKIWRSCYFINEILLSLLIKKKSKIGIEVVLCNKITPSMMRSFFEGFLFSCVSKNFLFNSVLYGIFYPTETKLFNAVEIIKKVSRLRHSSPSV